MVVTWTGETTRRRSRTWARIVSFYFGKSDCFVRVSPGIFAMDPAWGLFCAEASFRVS